MKYLRPSKRLLFLAFLPLIVAAIPAYPQKITLPAMPESRNIYAFLLYDSIHSVSLLDINNAATGSNNLRPLRNVTKKNLPALEFKPKSAYAKLELTHQIRFHRGNWRFECGLGMRDAYEGNNDAGQFYLDLRSRENTRQTYHPSANNVKVETSWLGIGHSFPLRLKGVEGKTGISVRYIKADDFLARSIVGNVDGDDFTGMMKQFSAETKDGMVRGYGWSLDGAIDLKIKDSWLVRGAAEGIMGSVTWNGLAAEERHIVSPRVFEDADGFKWNIGGISGNMWKQDMKFSLKPLYRLDILSLKKPHAQIGLAHRVGENTVPYFGMAFPAKKNWLSYGRYYPTQSRVEIGAVGHSWRLNISADDWIFSNPKHVEIAISANAVKF